MSQRRPCSQWTAWECSTYGRTGIVRPVAPGRRLPKNLSGKTSCAARFADSTGRNERRDVTTAANHPSSPPQRLPKILHIELNSAWNAEPISNASRCQLRRPSSYCPSRTSPQRQSMYWQLNEVSDGRRFQTSVDPADFRAKKWNPRLRAKPARPAIIQTYVETSISASSPPGATGNKRTDCGKEPASCPTVSSGRPRHPRSSGIVACGTSQPR